MAQVSFKSHGQILRFLKFRVSGALVRILRIYTRILRILWAGVSGDIPGVSGLDHHQHIFFFPILSSLVLIFVVYLGMVRPRAGESLEDAEQRRQKRRHDPHTQREDAPRNPPRELRPRIVRARNPMAAVQERSQGKLLTFCKAEPRLLHPVRLRQARVLLMTYVLRPLLAW